MDGDTSTNDTVLLLASGHPFAPELDGEDDGADFERALVEVCRELAWRIVRDGEGATRVMEITIEGAASVRDVKLAAHAVATSPLVKTALHGGDPNWGRILAAVGRSGARVAPARVRLAVNGLVSSKAEHRRPTRSATPPEPSRASESPSRCTSEPARRAPASSRATSVTTTFR